MLLLVSVTAQAQRKKPTHATDADRLGMTCAQVLKIASSDWVAKFTSAKAEKSQAEEQSSAPPASSDGPDPEFEVRAIAAYGKCYDARTDQLAATLGRTGKGPLMGARGDFGDFERSLQNFETAALANVQPPASKTKKAYAALYEKQFRYAFYLSYVPHPAAPLSSSTRQPSAATTTRSAPPSSKAEPGESSSVRPDGGKPPSAAEEVGGEASANDEAEDFTKAKNRFGQLLEALPEDNAKAVHSALGSLLGAYEVSQETRLNVYLYAIYLLEPESAKPFAPPPF